VLGDVFHDGLTSVTVSVSVSMEEVLRALLERRGLGMAS
jgi:hypothetical protein